MKLLVGTTMSTSCAASSDTWSGISPRRGKIV
jgi:hypothetical protein